MTTLLAEYYYQDALIEQVSLLVFGLVHLKDDKKNLVLQKIAVFFLALKICKKIMLYYFITNNI